MSHLILDTCVLSLDTPPMSDILSNKRINYEKVTFGLVKSFHEDFGQFWKKLAETVKGLDVTQFDSKSKDLDVVTILLHFPGMTCVYLNHQSFLKCFHTSRVVCCDSVRQLHLSNFISNGFEQILSRFPNVTDIYIESTTCEDPFPVDFVKTYASLLKRVIIRASPREWVQIISELDLVTNLQLETLECKIEKEQTIDLLCNFLPKQKNLTKVVLHTNRVLVSPIPSLKILFIDFIQDLVSFKPFETLIELEELHLRLSRAQHRFQHQNSECFFGHHVIQVSHLKKLFLEEFNDKSCMECYEGLFQGCQGLETLSIVQTTVSTGVFDLLVNYQKNLTELRIELARISEPKIVSLCQALPLLKILELKATVIQGCSDSIILLLCQHLPRLTELRVTMLDITESSFDHVANHCQNLRTLYLSIGGNFDLERIFRTFECLPNLNRICNILSSHDLTRIDYHEVFERKSKTLDSYLGRRNWTQIDYYVMTWDVEEGNNINASDSFTIRTGVEGFE